MVQPRGMKGALVFLLLLSCVSLVYAQTPQGEVYVVKDLNIANFHRGTPVHALVTIDNKRFSDPFYASSLSHAMQVFVRDREGNLVSGFGPVTLNFTSATLQYDLPLEDPPNAVFKLGEAYRVEVRVLPYVDASVPARNEKIIGNNFAQLTFAVVPSPTTVQVPDMPLMNVFATLSLVMMGLYAFTRKTAR